MFTNVQRYKFSAKEGVVECYPAVCMYCTLKRSFIQKKYILWRIYFPSQRNLYYWSGQKI